MTTTEQRLKIEGEVGEGILLPAPEPKGEIILAGTMTAAELALPKLIIDAGDKAVWHPSAKR